MVQAADGGRCPALDWKLHGWPMLEVLLDERSVCKHSAVELTLDRMAEWQIVGMNWDSR